MNDPTRFDLDERQRAMLAEMGVRVWTPASPSSTASPTVSLPAVAEVSAAAPMAVPVRPVAPFLPARAAPSVPMAPVATAATPKAAPVRVETAQTPLPVGLAEMDWPELQTAAAACQACGLCAQRQHSVFGMGSMQADWLLVGDAPGDEENASGQPFTGEAGRLLDNMLKAMGLNRQDSGERGAYLMHATQCPTPGERNPTAQELQICAAYVARKVALVQPRMILVMGRFAMQALLQTHEPLGKMRGQVHSYQGVPLVVTYAPAYLLRNQADKGKAWADLCLALQTRQRA